MSTILQTFCQDTYSQFEADLISKWAVDPSDLAKFASIVKGMHRRQLSLGCMATIAGLRAPRNEYAAELVEATYLSIMLAVKGLENCACVLVRQTIELGLKHIYFAEHPVEYGWVATREGYREPNFHALLEYVKRTSEYQEFSKGGNCDLCEGIEEKFGVLSRYVHMQSKRFMSYKRMRMRPRVDGTILRRVDSLTAFLWPALTAMLMVFFPARFGRSREIEKRLIRSTLSRQLKAALAGYIRTRSSV
jgi:hypothetical protein